MSFNKRYYDIDMLVEIYTQGGLEDIKNQFKKIDSLFFKDKISSKIYKYITEDNDKKVIKLLENRKTRNK